MNVQFRSIALAGLVAAAVAVACGDPVVQSAPPNVFIEEPADSNAAYLEGEAVTFRGSAIDPEDGPLTGNALLWLSDIDGPLGRGGEIVVDDLSAASHQIYLIAQDSDGVRGSATTGIVVRAGLSSVIDR